ncbi:hypothetical protein LH685_16915 [Acinetobacter nosocomialis]|uniref:DEAD/DEAH box helicase n=1 Tax=Acinetobacter nosocomialis TaxID=106654 RepID=UPI001F1D32DD|nr:DEAD/DEAH box helicase [Acinetobacter nosocomialis]MCF1297449.1 hypothetical protein [Acinetobacter nosocomialis]
MGIFEELHLINELLLEGHETDAREKIIRLINNLDEDEKVNIISPLNDLIRQVGLYPYMVKDKATWQEKFLLEAFTVDIGDKKVVLHREQSKLLSGLLDGKNLAVSAPTSFGKSFIVDAFLQLSKPKTVMMIVPTIALADEIRRRLQPKFGREYKIITTVDVDLAERSILILPQERALSYQGKIQEIDLLIVDEFYKASAMEKDSRSISLQKAMLEFQQIAKQRYYLAPNISDLTTSIFTKGIEFISIDCNTVVLNIEETYKEINENYTKLDALVAILEKVKGKSLIYVNSHAALIKVSTVLSEKRKIKNNIFLNDFAVWIRKNYSDGWSLSYLIEKGIANYNSNLHRSLTQIQLNIYESDYPLDVIISTSSIIEGVNTCTKNVILWSNKLSKSSLSFFTYKNIVGRSGRMFKYFVGEAYLLEKPPKEQSLVLDIQLQDEASLLVDENYFSRELRSEDLNKIISFKKKMAEILGIKYSELISFQDLDFSESSNLQNIAYAILTNAYKFKNIYLLNADSKYWRIQLNNIFYTVKPNNFQANYTDIINVILAIEDNWSRSIPAILSDLEDCGIDIDKFFKLERIISYNVASFLKSFELIYNNKNAGSLNIGGFIEKLSHSFLPKNVFYLEEFGLPRFISKKIHRSNLIDLEDNNLEINQVIDNFLEIGFDELIERVPDLDTFDKYVIGFFYDGIGG